MYGNYFPNTHPAYSPDTDQSNWLEYICGSDLTADRQLTFVTGDSNRSITLQGNPTLDDWFDQSVKTTADVLHNSFRSELGGEPAYLLGDESGDNYTILQRERRVPTIPPTILYEIIHEAFDPYRLIMRCGSCDITITDSQIVASGDLNLTGNVLLSMLGDGIVKQMDGILAIADPNVDYEPPISFETPLSRTDNLVSLSYDSSTLDLAGDSLTVRSGVFLGVGETAADSDLLDGYHADAFGLLAENNEWSADNVFLGTVTIGIDDTGYDVTFYGDTTAKSWLWDASADKMIVTGNASVSGTFTLGNLFNYNPSVIGVRNEGIGINGPASGGCMIFFNGARATPIALFGSAISSAMCWNSSYSFIQPMSWENVMINSTASQDMQCINLIAYDGYDRSGTSKIEVINIGQWGQDPALPVFSITHGAHQWRPIYIAGPSIDNVSTGSTATFDMCPIYIDKISAGSVTQLTKATSYTYRSAYFGNQVLFDQEVGTAPFAVTSTTVVANLNADKLDGYDAISIPAGGADTQFQYNDGGVFNGDSGFTFNKTTGVITYTCHPNNSDNFVISSTENARHVGSQAMLSVGVDFTWSDASSGASPVGAMRLQMQDKRTITSSPSGVDFGQTMTFNQYRTSDFNDNVGAIEYFLAGQVINLSDAGNYNYANNLIVMKGIDFSSFNINPTFNGTSGTDTYKNYLMYCSALSPEPISGEEATSTVNIETYGIYFSGAPSLSSVTTPGTNKVYGLYYNVNPNGGTLTNYVMYAPYGHIGQVKDNSYFIQGTGSDVRITYTGTYWDFDVRLATTSVRFNQNQINTDFEVHGDDRITLFIDAQAGASYYQANTTTATAFQFRDASGNVDFNYDETNNLFDFRGDVRPYVDDTYYLGKNSATSPLAWKGLILKDTTNGYYYRCDLTNGAWTITKL